MITISPLSIVSTVFSVRTRLITSRDVKAESALVASSVYVSLIARGGISAGSTTPSAFKYA